MMKRVAAYRATQVPCIEYSDHDALHADIVKKQEALWCGVQMALASQPALGAAVEYRLFTDQAKQHIVLEILCYCRVERFAPEVQAFVALVENLLPSEYGWLCYDEENQHSASYRVLDDSDWYITRLVRPLHFIDLPQGPTQNAELNTPDATAEQPEYRQIPTSLTTAASHLLDQHCIPTLPNMAYFERGGRPFFGQMQRQQPCVVSLLMTAIDRELFRSVRPILSSWQNELRGAFRLPAALDREAEPWLGQQGWPHDLSLLPDSQLCSVVMRVAGKTPAASIAVAQHLAMWLGGLSSFMLHRPQSPKRLAQISNPWTELPNLAGWGDDDWLKMQAKMLEYLESQGILTDSLEPSHLNALAQMPYVFTQQEACTLLRLPISDQDGMPGIDAVSIAPFTSNIKKPLPVFVVGNGQPAAAPPAEIRIGISWPNGSPLSHAANAPAAPGMAHANDAHWHSLNLRDLTKHAFVVGSTGSGKSMTTLFLLRELARTGTPFLVIEPVKTEYFDRLSRCQQGALASSLHRFRFEGGPDGKRGADFLPFDAMRVPVGVSIARHASYLKSCFEAAFPLEPVMAMLLETGIREYYTAKAEVGGCGFNLFKVWTAGMEFYWTSNSGKRFLQPSLSGFMYFFLGVFLPANFKSQAAASQSQAEMQDNFQQLFKRRFGNLQSGAVGEAALQAQALYEQDPASFETLAPYLQQNTIIELDAIPDADQKSLLMSFLLSYLFERRQADDYMRRNRQHFPDFRGSRAGHGLEHVLVLEEAHRLLAAVPSHGRRDLAGASSREKAVSLFVDMLAEIRAYGQGLMIVEQIPTKIAADVVKNTNLKIMLRLTARDDREFLGDAMDMSEAQKRFITRLRADPGHGIDMVVFEEGVERPLVLNLPLPDSLADDWLFNEFFE